jgi:excisionase family DNA binding protein
MAGKKYIKTVEVAELTGRPYSEILRLVNSGVLLGYKTHRGRWLINNDAVEKYFGIKIDSGKECAKTESKIKPTIASKRECEDKLICGHTARKYLNCSKAEFENLVNLGHIQAYRDEYMRWKVSKESVLNYAKQSQLPCATRLITNKSHYEEVVERICSTKSSIRIMTANFKRFRLEPTDEQAMYYGTPFIERLIGKAVQGVSIQIICSMPSKSFTKEWMEYFQQMDNPKLFEYKFCERNHAKVFIIDDKSAYVGSANVTRAGLRQDTSTQQNFEAGILTEDPELVSSIKAFFTEIWNSKWCECNMENNCEE